jgi:hypothetical protein
MEPVLVRTTDLNLDIQMPPQYPRSYEGEIIWKGSDYVVVGVVKIHFKPHSIRIGSRETKVIKKLSRSLGTELLSYQLRQDTIKAMEKLANDRLNACNILADSLRNAITKSGLIFSLLKQEIGFLREQWEKSLLEELNEVDGKAEAIKELNEILFTMGNEQLDLRRDLVDVQNKFLELSIPPKKGENWVTMQIEERWKELLDRYPQDSQKAHLIWKTIDRLKKSLYFGEDPKNIRQYNKIPEEIKQEWVHLIYGSSDRFNVSHLDRLVQLLGHPELKIPYREKAAKAIIQLKALAETMNALESNTNFLIHQVLNGG